MPKPFIDMIGMKCGNWTVVERAPNAGKCQTMWLCECACGKRKIVNAYDLRTGHSKSCGCLKNVTHGDARYNENARLYSIWQGIKRRCTNESSNSYKNYGARGINMCSEWSADYKLFRSWALSHGYSDELSIDRIDVNGNYSPENCRWSTFIEQQNNKRTCHYIEVNGETHTIREWSRLTGVSENTIYKRIRKNKPVTSLLLAEYARRKM